MLYYRAKNEKTFERIIIFIIRKQLLDSATKTGMDAMKSALEISP